MNFSDQESLREISQSRLYSSDCNTMFSNLQVIAYGMIYEHDFQVIILSHDLR